MKVQIRAKDVTLHADARAHIESAIDGFSRYSLDITSVNVSVKTEKKGISIEFDIRIAHSEPVIINQSDDDLDSAIDLAVERASKALRRLHTKIIDHNKISIKELESIDS
nr:ribosome-associated translation inhibitor RaiA [uncultured Sulfurimonas sp.]